MTLLSKVSVLVMMTLLTAPTFAQTTVHLKTSTRLPDGLPVTLGDVATINGPLASDLAPLKLTDAPPAALSGTISVSLDQVRDALVANQIRLGRVALRGSSCTVRFARPVRTTTKPEPSTARTEPVAINLTGQQSVRTSVANRLAFHYGVSSTDLRLAFNPANDGILDMHLAGRRVDVQPTISGSSPRIPVRITVFSGDRILVSQTITVEVVVRRQVVIAQATLDRRTRIAAEHVKVVEQWAAPSTSEPADLATVLDSMPRTRIPAGQTITTDRLESPIVVRRNDIVFVDAISGSFHIKVKARAMEAGRIGQSIELKLDGANEHFQARIDGRGSAVMEINPAS